MEWVKPDDKEVEAAFESRFDGADTVEIVKELLGLEAENKRLKEENLKLEIKVYRQAGQEPPDIPKFKDYHKQKALNNE